MISVYSINKVFLTFCRTWEASWKVVRQWRGSAKHCALSFCKSTVQQGVPSFLHTKTMGLHHSTAVPTGTGAMIPFTTGMVSVLHCSHNWKGSTFVKYTACKLLLNTRFQFENVFFGWRYDKRSGFVGGGVLLHLVFEVIGNHPWQGRKEPQTTEILFLIGWRCLFLVSIYFKCWGLSRQILAPHSGKISILVDCSLGLTLICACTVAETSFVWDEGELYVSLVLS